MKRISQVFVITALCALAGAAPQQHRSNPQGTPMPAKATIAPPESRPTPQSVAPITMSDADGQELILEELSVRTAVEGMLSLTELDLRFRNPKAKRVEGRFSCTLPATAAISRFAKEVNGQLMEGEVVERLRANQVYEQFLHQMRDPALLEQDQGNRFSARIFPIEANASVRLVLSYSALLPLEGGAPETSESDSELQRREVEVRAGVDGVVVPQPFQRDLRRQDILRPFAARACVRTARSCQRLGTFLSCQ